MADIRIIRDHPTGTGRFQHARHRLTADRGLLPSYFVRIRIPVWTTKDALFVPDEAIGGKRGSRTLLVVNAQDVFEQGVVGLGASASANVTIPNVSP